MFRKTLALLLIPGVLLAQFAAVPHAHVDEAGPHPTHPHFHFHQLNPTGVARGAAPARCCSDSGSLPRAACAPDSDTHTDHDADAVYVEAGAAAPERLDHPGGQPLAAPVPPLPLDFLRCVVARPAPPPARTVERCPVYVRHLTLTI